MYRRSFPHSRTVTEVRITVTLNEMRGWKRRLRGFDHFSVMVWGHVAKRHFITSGELGLSLYPCQVGGVYTLHLCLEFLFFPYSFLFFVIENSHIEDWGGLCLTTVTTLLSVASALSSTHCSASHPERQPGVAAGQLEGFWLVCLFALHFRPAGAQTMVWSWRSWQVSSKICTSFRTLVQIEGSWCLPTAPVAFWSPHGAETGRVIITIIVNVINDHMHNAQTLRWNWKVAVD